MKLQRPAATLVALFACTLLTSLRPPTVASPASGPTSTLSGARAAAWNDDPIWYDGKAEKAVKALEAANPAMWKALRNQGIFLGRGGP